MIKFENNCFKIIIFKWHIQNDNPHGYYMTCFSSALSEKKKKYTTNSKLSIRKKKWPSSN